MVHVEGSTDGGGQGAVETKIGSIAQHLRKENISTKEQADRYNKRISTEEKCVFSPVHKEGVRRLENRDPLLRDQVRWKIQKRFGKRLM